MCYFPPDGMAEGRCGFLKRINVCTVMINAFASFNVRSMDFFACCYHVYLGTNCTSKKPIIILE